ncbi:MAG: hypothetical protein IJA85_01715 [Clostridia bacterium]|nr:hypothetical protein [Clostridia bacterium]
MSYSLHENIRIPLDMMEGDISIAFRFTCQGEGSYQLGISFGKGEDDRFLRFCVTQDPLLLMYHGAGKMLLRAFPHIYKGKENSLKIELYRSLGLVRYHVNGCFYGERLLCHPTDPKLDFDRIALYCDGDPDAVVERVTIEAAVSPRRDYVISTENMPPVTFEEVFPRAARPAEKIYFIDGHKLNKEDYFTAVTLQGLVNRAEPQLYVHYGRYNGRGADAVTEWYRLLEEKGRELVPITLEEALEQFSDYYHGVVTGSIAPCDGTDYAMNIATMVCGVKDYIYAGAERNDRIDCSLPRFRLDSRFADDVEAYKWAKEELWPHCHHGILCHSYGDCDLHFTDSSRDYLVQNKIFSFNSAAVKDEEDYYFYFDLLAMTPPNTPVLGIASRNGESRYDSVLDEDALFRACAELGKFFVYSFSVDNMSLFSGLEAGNLKQKPHKKLTLDPEKRYVSFLLSEGENYAWAYQLWNSTYRKEGRGKVAIGWSTAGAMYYLAPAVLEWYYANAEESDCWYLDGNGIGDMYNPDIYGIRLASEKREAALTEYLSHSRELIRRADLPVMRIFDATYSVTDASAARYMEAIPELTAIYTGYNSEPDMDTFVGSEYMLAGKPVFHTRVVSLAPKGSAEGDGQVLLEGILREIASEDAPSFINVFVLGNYLLREGAAPLIWVKEHLPEYCEVVRPDQLAELYEQYAKEK